MSLWSVTRVGALSGPPRASGDEPVVKRYLPEPYSSAPRERG